MRTFTPSAIPCHDVKLIVLMSHITYSQHGPRSSKPDVITKSVLYTHAEDYVLVKDTFLVESFNNTKTFFMWESQILLRFVHSSLALKYGNRDLHYVVGSRMS